MYEYLIRIHEEINENKIASHLPRVPLMATLGPRSCTYAHDNKCSLFNNESDWQEILGEFLLSEYYLNAY